MRHSGFEWSARTVPNLKGPFLKPMIRERDLAHPSNPTPPTRIAYINCTSAVHTFRVVSQAMNRPIGVAIRGTGSCVPSRVVTNDEFAATLETSDEWIRSRTGIRERRIVGPNDTAATLGTEAAKRALTVASVTPADIDLIVCATVTPDMMCPSTANLIQAYLGCRTIPSFDVTAACSGFVYALSVGEQYVRTGTAKTVLVIGAEALRRPVVTTFLGTYFHPWSWSACAQHG